ncbi:hypothetical protein D3C72_1999970 [compost metagenome]
MCHHHAVEAVDEEVAVLAEAHGHDSCDRAALRVLTAERAAALLLFEACDHRDRRFGDVAQHLLPLLADFGVGDLRLVGHRGCHEDQRHRCQQIDTCRNSNIFHCLSPRKKIWADRNIHLLTKP